jgi:hypothetical protein
MNYLGVLGIVNGDLPLSRHDEPVPSGGVLGVRDPGRGPLEPAREAASPADEVDHGERSRAADGERDAARRVHGEPLDGLAAREGAERGEEHEAVGVVEVERAVVAGGEEVPRHGAARVEGERGDGGQGVEERAEVGGGGQVVEADGVVRAAGRRQPRARRRGHAADRARVGRVGEERREGEHLRRGVGGGGEGFEGKAPDEALVGAGDEGHSRRRGGEKAKAFCAPPPPKVWWRQRGRGGGFCLALGLDESVPFGSIAV